MQEIDADQTAAPLLTDEVDADCFKPVDGIAFDGLSIEVDGATAYDGRGCFTDSGRSVLLADAIEDVVLYGAGQALSNDQVLRADNAAVALRLLGEDERLVWYVPDPTDAETDETVTLGSLLPDWIGPGIWMLALACVGLILWRFRRLGPLSTEPLPVVVRAVETTRSRGRMYRKSRDRDHAARALRAATSRSLAARLRLDRGAAPATVAEAAARHLGRPTEEIDALLLDDRRPPPASDQELVWLAQALARLRREVRRG
jgi:PAS domain-containing protein